MGFNNNIDNLKPIKKPNRKSVSRRLITYL